jgi:hypothetical protein
MKKVSILILIVISLLIVTGLVEAKYSYTNETASVGGRVTDSEGNTISGALVLAQSSFGTEYDISDDSGFYVLNNLPLFENIKISCIKERYNIFQTSVYIDTVGFCLLFNIELQEINTNIIENSIDNYNQ